MTDIVLEIVVILVLVIANGVFATAEIAVVSARKARLRQRADDGNDDARVALALAREPNRFLATIQIGITLVGVLAGAFGGATIANKLSVWLSNVPLLASYSTALGVGIVVLAITYLSLILGELVPKRLALNNPEGVATALARPMQALSVLAYPVVRLLSLSTNAVLWVLRMQPTSEPPVTEEEISIMIGEGIQAGVFEEGEQDLVEGVFRFADRHVSTLMTPRTDIVWLDVDDPPEDTERRLIEAIHSRFPVGRGNLDNILGIAYTKDLLSRSLAGQPLDPEESLRSPLFVPENARALRLLESLKQSSKHIALVVNEYGGVEGLVTVTDILEAIVGDIPSVYEPSEPQVIRRRDGSWLIDGSLPVEELKELLDIDELPGGEKASYATVSGLMMTYLEHIPTSGDQFTWAGWQFEVVDMDRHRVDKVLAQRHEEM